MSAFNLTFSIELYHECDEDDPYFKWDPNSFTETYYLQQGLYEFSCGTLECGIVPIHYSVEVNSTDISSYSLFTNHGDELLAFESTEKEDIGYYTITFEAKL